MSSSQSEPGCGMAILALILLAVAYFVGLAAMDGMTEGARQWWHYVAALPVGIICVNLVLAFFRLASS